MDERKSCWWVVLPWKSFRMVGEPCTRAAAKLLVLALVEAKAQEVIHVTRLHAPDERFFAEPALVSEKSKGPRDRWGRL